MGWGRWKGREAEHCEYCKWDRREVENCIAALKTSIVRVGYRVLSWTEFKNNIP